MMIGMTAKGGDGGGGLEGGGEMGCARSSGSKRIHFAQLGGLPISVLLEETAGVRITAPHTNHILMHVASLFAAGRRCVTPTHPTHKRHKE